MKKNIFLMGLITASMLLTGCDFVAGKTSNNTSSNSTSSQTSGSSLTDETPHEKGEWTIMIYLCGSDLESGSYQDEYGRTCFDAESGGFASEDIEEICSVKNQPDDVNIIIETGGALKWYSNYNIPSKKIARWHVENNKLVKNKELPQASMGQASTFQSFLEWGLNIYPAEKTGVILWNHGGAMRGVCYDENYKDNNGACDTLLNSEIQSAVTGAFTTLGRTDKLEFIGYDACLMQVQDIAEAHSEHFNYLIASEESEAGEGWAYDKWVDDLYAKRTTPQIISAICDGFIDAFDEKYSGKYDNDQTLSGLDLSKMATYKTAWETFASQLSTKLSSYGKSNFQNLMKQAKEYGTAVYTKDELEEMGYSTNSHSQYYYGNYGIEYHNGYYYDYGYNYFAIFDVVDVLNKIKNNISGLNTYIENVKTALSDLVIKNATGDEAGASNGLCCYFPCHSLCSKSTYYSTNETNFTSWRSIVNSYGA